MDDQPLALSHEPHHPLSGLAEALRVAPLRRLLRLATTMLLVAGVFLAVFFGATILGSILFYSD